MMSHLLSRLHTKLGLSSLPGFRKVSCELPFGCQCKLHRPVLHSPCPACDPFKSVCSCLCCHCRRRPGVRQPSLALTLGGSVCIQPSLQFKAVEVLIHTVPTPQFSLTWNNTFHLWLLTSLGCLLLLLLSPFLMLPVLLPAHNQSGQPGRGASVPNYNPHSRLPLILCP